MNKNDVVKSIASKVGISQSLAKDCLDAFTTTVKQNIKKKQATVLVGFGTFDVAERKGRKGRNPKTLEEIMIPAKVAVTFKAGSELKGATEKLTEKLQAKIAKATPVAPAVAPKDVKPAPAGKNVKATPAVAK